MKAVCFLIAILAGTFRVSNGNQSTTGTLYIALRTLITEQNHVQYFAFNTRAEAETLIASFVASTAVPFPCSNAVNPCGDGATCNVLDTYLITCACGDGFRQNYTLLDGALEPILVDGTETQCEDIDECQGNSTICGEFTSQCNNLPGTYNCTCDDGYMLIDNSLCIEDDPCYYFGCDQYASCVNTSTMYECVCDSGYDGNGTYCQDFDECLNNAANCHEEATCFNTPGGYTCSCNAGYEGDGFNCTDINECNTAADNCPTHSDCVNTIGSFECFCHAGYTTNNCTDINECNQPRICSPHADCINTDGSYTCSCHGGFSGNGTYCDDVDECTNGQDNCHENGTCTNHIGDFSCCCNYPYYGNGTYCMGIPPPQNLTECSFATVLHGDIGLLLMAVIAFITAFAMDVLM